MARVEKKMLLPHIHSPVLKDSIILAQTWLGHYYLLPLLHRVGGVDSKPSTKGCQAIPSGVHGSADDACLLVAQQLPLEVRCEPQGAVTFSSRQLQRELAQLRR